MMRPSAAAFLLLILQSLPVVATERNVERETCLGAKATTVAATIACSKVVEGNPRDLAARIQRGELLATQAGGEAGRFDAEAVIAVDATTSEDFDARARAFELLERPEEARAAYDRALALEPANATALIDRGFFRQSLGDAEGARSDFAAAIAAAPDDFTVRLHHLRYAVEAGDETDRLADYEALARLDERPGPWLSLAVTERLGRGDVDGALETADRLVAADPKDADSHKARARTLVRAKRDAEALAEWREVLRLAPTDFAVAEEIRKAEARAAGRPTVRPADPAVAAVRFKERLNSAKVLMAMNQRRAAIRELDDALFYDNNAIEALRLRGHLSLDEGDARRAIGDFDLVLRREPKADDIRALRGRAKFETGDLAGAEDDLEAAIAAGIATADAFADRARMRGAHGDLAGARADAEAALRLAPDETAHRRLVALLAFAAGDFAQAAHDFSVLSQARRGSAFAVAWSRHAAARLGRAEPAEVAVGDDDPWDAGVLLFLSGFVPPERLLEVAGDDPMLRCDAHVQIAETMIERGEAAEARGEIEAALALCPEQHHLVPVLLGERRRLTQAK